MCGDGGEAGSLPSLKLLNLSSNRVGEFGAKALADAMASGAMPSLGLLYLGSNRIGDAGLCALASASASASGLEQLYLEHNQIGCTGVTALADAATKLGATCRDKALSLRPGPAHDSRLTLKAGAFECLEHLALDHNNELMLETFNKVLPRY